MTKLSAILLLLITSSLSAQNITILGSIKQPVKLNTRPILVQKKFKATTTRSSTKNIFLLKLTLSPETLQTLQNRTKTLINHTTEIRPSFESTKTSSYHQNQIQLGMNEVPVLDQGSHGSCVTFANTAAFDAALQKGDYISQLCRLTLGRYFENNSYNYPSGWNGAWGRTVLNEISSFGIVSKEQEKAQGCGQLTDYPLEGPDPINFITLEDYKQISEEIPEETAIWSTILDPVEAISERIDPNSILEKIKMSLLAGNRLTFASLLIDLDLGCAGAIGKYHMENDAWILTPEIARDVYLRPDFAGHEMVITGFDDNAIALDDKNHEHRGLLTLRSSWGSDVGDKGDFYMSYDYFKLFVIEVHRIYGR